MPRRAETYSTGRASHEDGRIESAGLPLDRAILAAVTFNLGWIVGGLTIAWALAVGGIGSLVGPIIVGAILTLQCEVRH